MNVKHTIGIKKSHQSWVNFMLILVLSLVAINAVHCYIENNSEEISICEFEELSETEENTDSEERDFKTFFNFHENWSDKTSAAIVFYKNEVDQRTVKHYFRIPTPPPEQF